MNGRTLVIVTADEKYLSFRTVSREQKSPHRFMVPKTLIDDLYDLPGTVLCRQDCGSFAQFWLDPAREAMCVRFHWLQSNGFRVSGWEQTVVIPNTYLPGFRYGSPGETWKLLSLERPKAPRLVFRSARNLREVVNDPLLRRRFARFLRDHFQWPDASEIILHDDFEPYSFSFREKHGSREGISGGVILHGRDNLATAHYSIHT